MFNARNNPGAAIGAVNRELVRSFMRDHLGATNVEIAAALGLSVMATGRHVAAIRGQWLDPQPVPGLTKADQHAQALRCSCHGGDDMCPCQNAPDFQTRMARLSAELGDAE